LGEIEEKNNAYDKLTPQRKALVDMVLCNLENGKGFWEQGWADMGVPISAATGKRYRGINNLFLSLIAMERGYTDNRWATFNQINDRGWSFKKDEEGRSRGKDAGVTIEFYELYDKETKKAFDRSTLDGMTESERDEYMQDNVRPMRKYFRVFNGDIIEGIPEREKRTIDPSEKVERAEKLLEHWNDYEAKIVYGGDSAFYRPSSDEIHAPQRESFKTLHEFYGTNFHEIGHSTGHESRLNRDLSGAFGSEKYALEELRAELAAMFLEQDLEIAVSEKHIENNSRYIKEWHDKIKQDPDALFTAIADADKITRFIATKEMEAERMESAEPYAMVEDTDELGNTVYGVRMASSYGQTTAMLPTAYKDRDEMLAEFNKVKELPAWKDKEFYEVSYEQLQEVSEKRAKAEGRRAEREERPMYVLPSIIAARATARSKPVDMTERGVESLTRMSDIDVVERAKRTRGGEQFEKLYNGKTMFGNEEKDERALMARLAIFCNGDAEQLLRVFKSSGQYRDEKPNALYAKMARESIECIDRLKGNIAAVPARESAGKKHFGTNAKV
jgi:antirestriction protein ArdC